MNFRQLGLASVARLGFVFCWALLEGGAGQAQVIRPARVVDLHETMRLLRSRSDFSVAKIAQANGRWSVLLTSRWAKESAVITGDGSSERVSIVDGISDTIAMDVDHRVYLRQVQRRAATTKVTVLNRDSDESYVYEIPAASALSLLAGGKVLWKTREGSVGFLAPDFQGLRWTPANRPVEESTGAVAPTATYDHRFVLGLPEERYLVFGNCTESISSYDAAGVLRTTAFADLDAAYLSIGRTPPKAKVDSDGRGCRSRVIWASTSRDGLLYVCLSELPTAGPAYIAVINPEDGRFVRTLSAALPTSPWRRRPFNSDGVISPVAGATDDRIVIVDAEIGILAFY